VFGTARIVRDVWCILTGMLDQLITTHRLDLIKRCSEKAAERNESSTADASLFQHGVPLFLHQLVDTLRNERQAANDDMQAPDTAPASAAIGRAAALHGADLLLQGYDIEQVVREYGDVCQAVTGLAVEIDAEISADEFRTLNRCLDDAIADAVNAFSHAEQYGTRERGECADDRFHAFLTEHRRLIDVAIRAHTAIATGQVGITGATGNLLMDSLRQMRTNAQSAEAQLAEAQLAQASASVAAPAST
jgi:hypothetical protein